MHDSSRDLLLASVQQSAELQQSLEQVRSFAYWHMGVTRMTYRLRDITTYWWKIAKFLYPTCI